MKSSFCILFSYVILFGKVGITEIVKKAVNKYSCLFELWLETEKGNFIFIEPVNTANLLG